jgi:hypothetical protein
MEPAAFSLSAHLQRRAAWSSSEDSLPETSPTFSQSRSTPKGLRWGTLVVVAGVVCCLGFLLLALRRKTAPPPPPAWLKETFAFPTRKPHLEVPQPPAVTRRRRYTRARETRRPKPVGRDVFGPLDQELVGFVDKWPQCSAMPGRGSAAQHQAFCLADKWQIIGEMRRMAVPFHSWVPWQVKACRGSKSAWRQGGSGRRSSRARIAI